MKPTLKDICDFLNGSGLSDFVIDGDRILETGDEDDGVYEIRERDGGWMVKPAGTAFDGIVVYQATELLFFFDLKD
jgi:hypothetical protein